jgi:hypothetical protein
VNRRLEDGGFSDDQYERQQRPDEADGHPDHDVGANVCQFLIAAWLRRPLDASQEP